MNLEQKSVDTLCLHLPSFCLSLGMGVKSQVSAMPREKQPEMLKMQGRANTNKEAQIRKLSAEIQSHLTAAGPASG